MAVKIRLARRGRKKLARYDVVVADARAPRDGRFIEKLGTYNPMSNPATIELDNEKAFQWLMNGAQPTDTVKAMLSYRGIMLRKHLQVGVNKGAITQEEADKKLADWLTDKASKIQGKKDSLAKAKEDKAKARMEAEAKIKEARAEAIKKKNEVQAEAAEGTEAQAATEETPVADAPAPEAPAEETPKKEDTPATDAPSAEGDTKE